MPPRDYPAAAHAVSIFPVPGGLTYEYVTRKSGPRERSMSAPRQVMVALMCTALAQYPVAVNAATVKRTLPEGTRVYLELNELVSGKRGEAEVGEKVQCSVWRDVIHENVVFVKAGTAALCKVETIRHANIAGVKGKMSVGALETTAVDGQLVQLDGGYNKEGKSRMALSISLGVVLFLPLIFITGKAAELPDGTVFDAFTGPSSSIAVEVANPETRVVNLSGLASGLTVDIDYDHLAAQEKPKVFRLNIATDGSLPAAFAVDAVNGKRIDSPLPITIVTSDDKADGSTAVGEIDIRTLSKHFQQGINRFEVAYQEGSERIATEVILNIQI